MNIAEKLGISKEKYPNEFDNLINASETGFKSGIENRRKQLEYYRELEQQRDELLNLSISMAKELEKYYEMVPGYTSKEFNYSDDFEEIIDKSWNEIKELIND